MAKRIAGTCYIKVDGDQLTVAGSVTCSMATSEKEGLAGLNGPEGYKEQGRVPYIEVEVFHVSELPIATLEAMTEATITAELANGKTAVLSDAWLAGTIDSSAADGTATLRFEGIDGRWL